MNIVVLQTDICWADIEANLAKLDSMVDDAPAEAELIVLPEMFSTGFCMDAERVALPNGGEVLSWMQRKAIACSCAITGTVAVSDAGCYFNRMYFVFPDGAYRTYDKRHLFTFGGEDKVYTCGTERVVVEYKEFRFLLQVCYDLRFPVWSRCRGDYDAIIYVANWPGGRRDVWDTLLKARALENQCYVIGSNRVGNDDTGVYDGGSIIIGPYGKTIARCEDDVEGMAAGKIVLAVQDNFRLRFPALADADKFDVIV